MRENPMKNAAGAVRYFAPAGPAAALLAAALAVAAGVAGCVPPAPPATVEQATPQPAATPAAAVTPAPPPAAASPETLRALEQLTELKEELKKLLNAVEEIQFDRDRESAAQETARWQRENLFQDLDRRLLKLERDMRLLPLPGAAGAAVAAPAGPAADPGLTVVTPVLDPLLSGLGDSAIALGAPSATAALADAPAAGVDDAAAEADADAATVSVQEQQAYDLAFGFLKQSRYDDAIEGFQALADTWPDGQLADDAVYWKSEAQYVNREYEAALEGFTAVVTRYPDSSRLPEALLKTATIQHEIGAYPEAEKAFRDILERFPDHQVGTMARLRLGRPPYSTQ